MNNQFDELTKSMAQSVTRRGALKKFGVGIAGIALACLGLGNVAQAARKVKTPPCSTDADCGSGMLCCEGACVDEIPDWCDQTGGNACCCQCVYNKKRKQWYAVTGYSTCHPSYYSCEGICEYFGIFGACEGGAGW